MMADPGRVAVLIPTHDGGQFVTECLASALNQTWGDLRVIVGDDASGDDTVDLCRAVARTDRRVEVHASTERRGWVGNINALLDRVTEDAYVILAQDDLWDEGYVHQMASRLAADEDLVCAYSDIAGFGDRTLLLGYHPWDGDRHERLAAFASEFPTGVAYRGVTRRAVLDAGIRLRPGPRDSFHADTTYVMEVAACGRLCRVPGPLYRKRFVAGSVTTSWASGEDQMEAWSDHTIATLGVVGEMPLRRRHRRRVMAACLDRLVRLLRFEADPGLAGIAPLERAVAAAMDIGGRGRGGGWARARLDHAMAAHHRSLGQMGEARRRAVAAVSRDPLHAEARIVLAAVLSSLGERKAAVRQTRRAVATAPWSQWVRLGASWVLEGAGRTDAALAEAEAAAGLGLLTTTPLVRVARLREASGDHGGAQEAASRAALLDPEDPEVRMIRARIPPT